MEKEEDSPEHTDNCLQSRVWALDKNTETLLNFQARLRQSGGGPDLMSRMSKISTSKM